MHAPVFRYTNLDTPIHRLHPLVKFLYVILTLVLVMYPIQITDIPILLIWLGLSAVLWIIARIELRRFTTLMQILVGTFIFLLLIQGFTYRGGHTPLITFGHLRLWEADLGVITRGGGFRAGAVRAHPGGHFIAAVVRDDHPHLRHHDRYG